MGMSIDAPFIAYSELTDEIYVIDKKAKYCVTDQVMKAVVATNRAIPKADYENRLKADMVAIFTDLQLEIEEKAIELCDEGWWLTYNDIIQEKINSLKENIDGME